MVVTINSSRTSMGHNLVNYRWTAGRTDNYLLEAAAGVLEVEVDEHEGGANGTLGHVEAEQQRHEHAQGDGVHVEGDFLPRFGAWNNSLPFPIAAARYWCCCHAKKNLVIMIEGWNGRK